MGRPPSSETHSTTDSIYQYVKDFKELNGYYPTHRTIADEFGVVVSVVAYHIGKLKRFNALTDFVDTRCSRKSVYQFIAHWKTTNGRLPEPVDITHQFDIHIKASQRYLRDYVREIGHAT